jgi:hypothetical protein
VRKISKKDSSKKKDKEEQQIMMRGTVKRDTHQGDYKVMMFPLTKRVDNVIDQIIAQEAYGELSFMQKQPPKEAMDQLMKTLLKKKTNSMISSPEKRASLLRRLERGKAEKHEFLKGKSIIYKQFNFEKHEVPPPEILNRYNPNMIDKLSRAELRNSVLKLKEVVTQLKKKNCKPGTEKGSMMSRANGGGKMMPYPLTGQ